MKDKKAPKNRRQTYQLMVNGANSMPTRTPNLGCGKEENLFTANSSTLRQHSYEKNMAVQQLGSQAVLCQAPLWLGSSALVRSLLCFSANRALTLLTGKCAL